MVAGQGVVESMTTPRIRAYALLSGGKDSMALVDILEQNDDMLAGVLKNAARRLRSPTLDTSQAQRYNRPWRVILPTERSGT